MALEQANHITKLWHFVNDYEAFAMVARAAAPVVSFIPVENPQFVVGNESISIFVRRLEYKGTAEGSPSERLSERDVMQFVGEYFSKHHPVSLIFLHSVFYEVAYSPHTFNLVGSVVVRYHAVDLL